jgi:hypothetical protein
MSLPAPKPGLVIRYSFLWSNEEAKGATDGAKDRPCAIDRRRAPQSGRRDRHNRGAHHASASGRLHRAKVFLRDKRRRRDESYLAMRNNLGESLCPRLLAATWLRVSHDLRRFTALRVSPSSQTRAHPHEERFLIRLRGFRR